MVLLGDSMRKTLFRYAIFGAWMENIRSIEVIDTDDQNIICTKYENENKKEVKSTLDKKIIEEIKTIIKKHDEIKDIDTIELAPVLDGTTNSFEICFDGKLIDISACNIWWFADDKNVENHKKVFGDYPENALSILSLHIEIADVLVDNGVDIYYLKLDNF